jgi:hypothetical protein
MLGVGSHCSNLLALVHRSTNKSVQSCGRMARLLLWPSCQAVSAGANKVEGSAGMMRM